MIERLGRFRRLLTDGEGQDLLEYSMLVALIAILAVGAVSTLGNTVHTVFWQTIAAAKL
jgi:Flp pilus assembly pilin Flp